MPEYFDFVVDVKKNVFLAGFAAEGITRTVLVQKKPQ